MIRYRDSGAFAFKLSAEGTWFWVEQRFQRRIQTSAPWAALAVEVPRGLKPLSRAAFYAGLKACST
jgi:hypothetical protein